ncbi:MAG: pyridoxamine kinase [Oscillospiraceae bacterium]|jgi:pyridoxine kinase|nr:pyridoxamine kinase [Oscillospiraceae bacterium]
MKAANTPKRILAIHDISGFGRCSLTVALPILSAMGLECVCVPTAVLSTHTGIGGYTCRDLTEDLPAVLAHYLNLGLTFDAIYSGFLGNIRQIELVRRFVDSFRRDGALFICDPAMADDGKLYPLFDTNFVQKMRSLCSIADVIVPNQTEAALLLDVPEHVASPSSSMLSGLQKLGAKSAVLTGAVNSNGGIGAAGIDSNAAEYFAYAKKAPGSYSGSGDIFASVLTGALTLGYTLPDAIKRAVDFTSAVIENTHKHHGDPLRGLLFEELLRCLM